MRFGSLFAGIGGMDLGLERAGMECAWQVEVDDYCRRVLTKHWPDVPKYGDIRELDVDQLERVDLVAGGFPCQPVSIAGRRKAQEDERWLWPEFARVLRVLRPRYALLENVPGLLTAGFADVLADLAALGYDADWDGVPAAAVGAPHLRWRVFVVAHARSEQRGLQPVVTGGEGATEARDDGTAQPVAHTDGSARDASGFTGQAVQGPETVERSGRRGGVVRPVSDTERTGLEGHRGECQLVFADRPPARSSWWSAEPDVGRSLDGFSAWLDRSGRLNEAHKVISAYADAEETRPAEVVRGLRDRVGAEDDGWAVGGPGGLPASAVLFAFLCQLSARVGEEGDAPLAGSEVSEDGVRSVWLDEGSACPPLRRATPEQRPGESPDPLYPLSQLLARLAGQAWAAYRRSDAGATGWGWEDGIARVATGVPSRVDRLRALGNAVVPQVAEHVGRLIVDFDAA